MIIAVKEKGKVVLGYSACDVVSTATRDDLVLPENACVWKVKGNPHTVMGGSLPSAELDAYRYEEGIFGGRIDFHRLVSEIVPAIEEFGDDKEYIGEDDDYEELLIAQDDRLYLIKGEHVVSEVEEYMVFSSTGAIFDDGATGVLYATAGEPALERIIKTYEFLAKEWQCECYPIAVIDTATEELRILRKGDR